MCSVCKIFCLLFSAVALNFLQQRRRDFLENSGTSSSAIGVDQYQTAPFRSSLVRVCAVCHSATSRNRFDPVRE